MARGIVAACIGGLLTVVVPGYAAAAEEDSRAVLALVREAVTATQTNLRTGRASGSFRKWRGENELVQSLRFSGAFDGSKYHLELAYEPTGQDGVPIECDKRIVVCDGFELFVSRFSENILFVGAEADIYAANQRLKTTAARGFPGSPKMLAIGVLVPEVLDKYTVKVERLANGHLLGKYEVTPTYHMAFEIAPEHGYHCILRESFVRTQLAYRWTVAWRRVDDLWHAGSGRMERYKDGKQREAHEWQFDKFEANVAVSPELFSLNALELPFGARLLDRRRPEGMPVFSDSGKPIPFRTRVYRFRDTEGKIEWKKADRLIEQVEAMQLLHQN
ncbi:MAG: hypothetical protein H8E44_39335 [Planctomycetes bacterium]|nr:hypothetical protein [Planctomycetota bacterium]MBL7043984.1 hypothetical protein [Pirellulaceae bacterium]